MRSFTQDPARDRKASSSQPGTAFRETPTSEHPLLSLQRTVGNQATRRYLERKNIVQRDTADGEQAATTGGTASGTTPAPPKWSTDVPYIHFDLLDFYESYRNPAGPYYYSAYVGRTRNDNPNFSNNLNPGPVRTTSTVTPSGWYAKLDQLSWNFATKFHVDTAAMPLPKEMNKFETQADIKFVPSSGGTGFEDHFADNSPQYISPTPGGPFALSTKPFAFAVQHHILEPGILQWDARLRVTAADLPLQIEFSAPGGCADKAVFIRALASYGMRVKDPAPGEKARLVRIEVSKTASSSTGTMEIIELDGTTSKRTLQGNARECEAIVKALALIYNMRVQSNDTVEIKGSQRVKFEAPDTQKKP